MRRLDNDDAGHAGVVYAASEVDAFVDELRATIDELRSELKRKEGQLASLRRIVQMTDDAVDANAPATDGEPTLEAMVGRAFLAAQVAADELVRRATAQAELILNGARADAAALLDLPRRGQDDGAAYAAPTEHDDRKYFDLLRSRVRGSDD